ncbi:MAG: Hsp20/alpha crystallin family protein, partial [Acidobacteriota bacterium]
MVDRRGAVLDMTALHKQVNRLFEQLALFERTKTGLGVGEWFPSVDVFETRGHVVIKVEAPGLGKNDLTVVCRGQKLVVSGEKKQPREEKTAGGYLCLERGFGKFTRSIYVDQAVELTKATAELGEGVLTITMPKLKD